MRIKVAILDQDQNYQNRLLVALRERYSDFMDIVPCTNQTEILKLMEFHNPDLFVINRRIDFDITQIGEDCAVAFFTELNSEKIDGEQSICKYQKLEDICRSLISIAINHYENLSLKKIEEKKAEEERIEKERKEEEERIEKERKEEEERIERERKAEEERLLKEQQEKEEQERREEEEKQRIEQEIKEQEEKLLEQRRNPRIISVIGTAPEEGSTVVSLGLAENIARRKKSILYINMKPYKSNSDIFTSRIQTDKMGIIVESSNESTLDVDILNDCIATDSNGIDYIPNTYNPFVVAALTALGLNNLINVIKESAKYDGIIFNLDSSINAMILDTFNNSNDIICVSSGFPDSNGRVERFYEAMKKYDALYEKDNGAKLSLVYNKFINRKCSPLQLPGVKVLGTINVYNSLGKNYIVENISNIMAFNQFIGE